MTEQLTKSKTTDVTSVLNNFFKQTLSEENQNIRRDIFLETIKALENMVKKEVMERLEKNVPKNETIADQSEIHELGNISRSGEESIVQKNYNPLSSFSFREGAKFVIDSIKA